MDKSTLSALRVVGALAAVYAAVHFLLMPSLPKIIIEGPAVGSVYEFSDWQVGCAGNCIKGVMLLKSAGHNLNNVQYSVYKKNNVKSDSGALYPSSDIHVGEKSECFIHTANVAEVSKIIITDNATP